MNPEYVIVDLGTELYLESYDPDYRPDPTDPTTGLAVWTPDLAEAMRFADAGAALLTWRTQSTVRPLRPDGKPNRPLSAYTIEVRKETA